MLIQVAIPSRTDVPEYQKLQNTVFELIGRINGKFSKLLRRNGRVNLFRHSQLFADPVYIQFRLFLRSRRTVQERARLSCDLDKRWHELDRLRIRCHSDRKGRRVDTERICRSCAVVERYHPPSAPRNTLIESRRHFDQSLEPFADHLCTKCRHQHGKD